MSCSARGSGCAADDEGIAGPSGAVSGLHQPICVRGPDQSAQRRRCSLLHTDLQLVSELVSTFLFRADAEAVRRRWGDLRARGDQS